MGGTLTGITVVLLLKPEALLINNPALLLIELPAILFIYLVIKNPHLLLIENPFSKPEQRNYTIDNKFNSKKNLKQQEMNKILDKIKTQEMHKLTEKERKKLDEPSK